MKAAVNADLDRDVRLGILEKVDVNLPVKWLVVLEWCIGSKPL